MNLFTSNIYRLRKENAIPNEAPNVGAIRFVSNTFDSITVEWDASVDTDGTIAEYQIWFTDYDTSTTSTRTVPGNVLEHTLTQLNVGAYSIRYRGKDNDGAYSPLSTAIFAQTQLPEQQTTSPDFTTQLNSPSQTSSSIQLNWVVTDDVGIESLVVRYRVSGTETWYSGALDVGSSGYNFGGLTSGWTYQFFITACDVDNQCTNSDIITETTL